MATLRINFADFIAAFLPVARAQLFPRSSPLANRIPSLQQLQTTLIPATLLPIPSLLGDLWDGLLNAVPKKKTSHMKKRHRQLASGKHLKDVTALNKCSSCGRAKRAHVLCPYCVQSIRRWLGNGFKSQRQLEEDRETKLDAIDERRRLRGQSPLKRKVKRDNAKEFQSAESSNAR